MQLKERGKNLGVMLLTFGQIVILCIAIIVAICFIPLLALVGATVEAYFKSKRKEDARRKRHSDSYSSLSDYDRFMARVKKGKVGV